MSWPVVELVDGLAELLIGDGVEIAFPVPCLLPVFDDRGPVVDRAHVRQLLQRALTSAPPPVFVTVGPGRAQGLRVGGDQAPVDGFVDRFGADMPSGAPRPPTP